MQDVSRNTFSFSSNQHGETLPSLINNVSKKEEKDASIIYEFMAVRDRILNKTEAVWVPPKDKPFDKRPLPPRTRLITQDDRLAAEAERIKRRTESCHPTQRKAHSNPTSPISNEQVHTMNKWRPLPKPPAKKSDSNTASSALSKREEIKKANQNRPLPKTPERPLPKVPDEKSVDASSLGTPAEPTSETITIPLAHADSFVKRSFQKLVEFAKRVLQAVSQLLFNMCDGFKKISMICIGPFTFRRKEKPTKEALDETGSGSAKSPLEIPVDYTIPPAPMGPSMGPPPPPPVPGRAGSWSQSLKTEMDKFEEEVNLNEHTLKRNKEATPLTPEEEKIQEEIQDSISLINKTVEDRRAAFEYEEDLDDGEFEWEFEFNPFNGNDSDIRIVAEDEKTKTIADVSIDLAKGEASVKTYSKLSQKQKGDASSLTSEALKVNLRKVEKKNEDAKAETPSSHPFGKNFFQKVEFADLSSDEDNSGWEDSDY